MDVEEKKHEFGEILAKWDIPVFEKHERTRNWYINAAAITLVLLIYALFTFNFLFAIIIIMSAALIVMTDKKEPHFIEFAITREGVMHGRKFYDYEKLRDFSVVYRPLINTRSLYIDTKSLVNPRLCIPLMDQDPLKIRALLLKYLPEDIDRVNPPFSEGLARFFKL